MAGLSEAAASLQKTLADTMTQTNEMRKVEAEHNLKMQKSLMEHNAQKAFTDALKQSANNVARMGGQG